MTALLLAALVAAGAANITLVAFVADRLSPQTDGALTPGELAAA